MYLTNLTINFTKTKSRVPIIVTKSANSNFDLETKKSKPCKCKKPGDLYGNDKVYYYH